MMTQRLREIAEKVWHEWRRESQVIRFEGVEVFEESLTFAERVARRVADEILALCDEGIAFQLNIKEFSEDRREWNAGIIRYLRGQIVRRFGLGVDDE